MMNLINELDFGRHNFYIWSSYGVAFAVLIAIAVWVYFDERKQRQILEQLEKRGLRRRSARAKQEERAEQSAENNHGPNGNQSSNGAAQ